MLHAAYIRRKHPDTALLWHRKRLRVKKAGSQFPPTAVASQNCTPSRMRSVAAPLSSALLALVDVKESVDEDVATHRVIHAEAPESIAKDVLSSVGEQRANWPTGKTELPNHLAYPHRCSTMRRQKTEGAGVLPAKAVWTLKPSSAPGGAKRHKLRVAA